MSNSDENQDLRDWMTLNAVNGVGPRVRRQLLEGFESVQEVLKASETQLKQIPGVGKVLAGKIRSAKDDIDIEAELKKCDEHGISVITEQAELYPRMLKEIHDPPGILYCKGELKKQDALAVAIVGTRHSTSYGDKLAEILAGGLARAGLTVVSGMARGVDAVAHRAALRAGGRTIAVLGSGLLKIYPPEHKGLFAEIAANGAVLSESPLERPPKSDAFPQRNRIVTGMSLGVVVIEAGARSGAMISAQHAMEQGREVFAVPGRVDSRVSVGCHQLIREGAKLVQNVDDILEELGPLVEPTSDKDGREVHRPAELQLNDMERRVLDHIEVAPTLIEKVVSDSGLPIHRVLSTISVLEMRKLITRVSGSEVSRK